MEKQTYNPCDECAYGIDRRDGSGSCGMCKVCEFKAQQQEIYQLRAQAAKIPDICFYERDEMGAFTYECRKNKSKCPTICPKNSTNNSEPYHNPADTAEIEHLKTILDDRKYNAKCDADHIAGLIADKDQQAGRIMRFEDGLKQARSTLQWLNEVGGLWFVTDEITKRIKAISALLGGTEDGKCLLDGPCPHEKDGKCTSVEECEFERVSEDGSSKDK